MRAVLRGVARRGEVGLVLALATPRRRSGVTVAERGRQSDPQQAGGPAGRADRAAGDDLAALRVVGEDYLAVAAAPRRREGLRRGQRGLGAV